MHIAHHLPHIDVHVEFTGILYCGNSMLIQTSIAMVGLGKERKMFEFVV